MLVTLIETRRRSLPALIQLEFDRAELARVPRASYWFLERRVFEGPDDYISSPDLAKAYVDTLNAPQKEFVILPAGDHFAVFTILRRL